MYLFSLVYLISIVVSLDRLKGRGIFQTDCVRIGRIVLSSVSLANMIEEPHTSICHHQV
jgi:hypothetical protein